MISATPQGKAVEAGLELRKERKQVEKEGKDWLSKPENVLLLGGVAYILYRVLKSLDVGEKIGEAAEYVEEKVGEAGQYVQEKAGEAGEYIETVATGAGTSIVKGMTSLTLPGSKEIEFFDLSKLSDKQIAELISQNPWMAQFLEEKDTRSYVYQDQEGNWIDENGNIVVKATKTFEEGYFKGMDVNDPWAQQQIQRDKEIEAERQATIERARSVGISEAEIELNKSYPGVLEQMIEVRIRNEEARKQHEKEIEEAVKETRELQLEIEAEQQRINEQRLLIKNQEFAYEKLFNTFDGMLNALGKEKIYEHWSEQLAPGTREREILEEWYGSR